MCGRVGRRVCQRPIYGFEVVAVATRRLGTLLHGRVQQDGEHQAFSADSAIVTSSVVHPSFDCRGQRPFAAVAAGTSSGSASVVVNVTESSKSPLSVADAPSSHTGV
ncbi:hypothetical protein C8039_03110 [Halogeometricum sp. wsp3]|nr:hypothetical protein C8039_03110 [Halogeometricum sp. wsp3]